jgi:hypothetical protein
MHNAEHACGISLFSHLCLALELQVALLVLERRHLVLWHGVDCLRNNQGISNGIKAFKLGAGRSATYVDTT